MTIKNILKRVRPLNQRGDTLIEVTIAIIIIGLVLFSAYVLSSKAFSLGQTAKERSQAAQILQSQAEGLRAIKDSASDWQVFCGLIEPNASSLHVSKSTGQWEVKQGAQTADKLDAELSSIYTVNASVDEFEGATGTKAGCTGADKVKLKLSVSWDRYGGGPQENSTLYLHLADTELPVISP